MNHINEWSLMVLLYINIHYAISLGLSGFLVGLLSGVLFGLLVMACTYKWYKKKN